MKGFSNLFKLFEKGTSAPVVLTATALIAFISILGITVLPDKTKPVVEMRIEPVDKIVLLDQTFEVSVVVESSVPVNVFAGELHFNPEVLFIESISYNDSVADLWAELPWYSNGDGTLTFGGGTTLPGGFLGVATLIKITFKTLKEDNGIISLYSPRVLLHDGLGTDAQLEETKDAIFFVENSTENKLPTNTKNSSYKIIEKAPSTDLNKDGKQSITDISIFMMAIAGNDTRYDFNLDGEVDIKDLNILLGAK